MKNCLPISENLCIFVCDGKVFLTDMDASILSSQHIKFDNSQDVSAHLYVPQLVNGHIYLKSQDNASLYLFRIQSIKKIKTFNSIFVNAFKNRLIVHDYSSVQKYFSIYGERIEEFGGFKQLTTEGKRGTER